MQKKIGVEKKIPDANKFIVTRDFNRLTKLNFHASFAKAQKNFMIKKIQKPIDLGDKSFGAQLMTWDLRKLGNIRKISKPHRIIPSCLAIFPR